MAKVERDRGVHSKNGSAVKESVSSEEEAQPAPPDGGWGWVVTFSSFMISFLVDGVCFTFGLLFTELHEYFGESKGKTSLLGSVLNGAYLSLGPIVAAFCNRFGCRRVAVAGGIMAFLGLFLSSFSPNLDVMIFLYGFVGGAGFGFMYLPSIVMVGYYFEKRRAFATGIAVCGSGIGGFVFAPITSFLLEKFSWQGTLWILSAVVLNAVAFSQAFRPLYTKNKAKSKCSKSIDFKDTELKPFCALDLELCEKHPIYRCKSVEVVHVSNGKNDTVARLAQSQDISTLIDNKPRHQHHHSDTSTLKPLSRNDIFYSGSLKNIPHSVNRTGKYKVSVSSLSKNKESDSESMDEDNGCSRVAKTLAASFDFTLLKSPTFIIYGISCFLCMFGFFIPFNFLPDLVHDLNLEKSQGATLIAIIGVSNTISRLVVGFVTDQPWANSLVINNLALVIGGVTTFAVPFYNSFPILIAYSIVFGAAIAAFVSLRSIIMVELMGIERLTNAFGLVVLCQGLSSFMGSPIAGSLSDETGTYNITFYLAGVTMFLAGVICVPLRRVAQWEGLQTETEVNFQTKVVDNDPECSPMLYKKSP
ncbi:monocarboxylate transporter 12-like [Saccostrea echinata]|uniref:monocarboxylate transporter 12-like n=1 Tax=Saccostrea echinata TaxID=191078 RepID=UPI002A8021D8|nr:monocarboxylate transporter 12-like [Saccostrea echinata]